MNVLVIGANGNIGSHVVRMLSLSTQYEATAMIRKEEQRQKMNELGAKNIVIGNLEEDFSHAFENVDAVIFAAGSGGHTGKDKTESVDKNGAIKAVEEAVKANVKKFIIVSSIMADKPEAGGEEMEHYLKAKGAADQALLDSGLTYTILRPGPLSDEPANGTITAKEKLSSYNGNIPREDVAIVAVDSLTISNTDNKIIELLSGETGIGEALNNF